MRSLRRTVKKLPPARWTARAVARAQAPRIIILRYHSIARGGRSDADFIPAGIQHSNAEFDAHMRLLASRFEPVTMDDVRDCLRGARPWPRRAAAVTFDDGYADNFEVAAPLMERHGIRGAFYVATNWIGGDSAPWFCRLLRAFTTSQTASWEDSEGGAAWNLVDPVVRNEARRAASRRCSERLGTKLTQTVELIERELGVASPRADGLMMSWEQVAELRSAGHLIGSHTVHHPNCGVISPTAAYEEAAQSKAELERRLGERVDHFSFPNPIVQPHWTPVALDAVRRAGYATGVVSDSGSVSRGADPLALRRLSAPRDVADLRWNLEYALAGGAP